MKALCLFLATIATLVMVAPATADHHEMKSGATSGSINADVLGHLADAKGKIFQLADAMPEKKYTWRPGKDVRSVSEVFMHVAGANYFLGNLLGTPIPEGMDPMGAEKKVTEKAKVVAEMKKSYDHIEGVIKGLSEEQLAEVSKTPFGDMSKRMIMLIVLRHADEHLGQSIAYARMNGVTPPWTAEQDAAAKAAADKGGN